MLAAAAHHPIAAAVSSSSAARRRPIAAAASSPAAAGRIRRLVLTPEGRSKLDPSPDRLFYSYPRFVTHADDGFLSSLTALYRERLPGGARVLDLMSSWVSHLPDDAPLAEVVGHGLNAQELSRNRRLACFFVKDLNEDQQLQAADRSFDAAVCAVSVQYLQWPEKVFAEVFRVLKPGGVFIVSFSDRMFYEKAVGAWRENTMYGRTQLVTQYFQCIEGFTQPEIIKRVPTQVSAVSNLFALGNSMVRFNGLNYTDWSEQILFHSGIMNIDQALVEDQPQAITENNTDDERLYYEAWERSNRLCLSLMKITMAENVKPSMPKTTKAKEFMKKIKEYSQSDIADKSIVGTLMSELTTKKFDWSNSMMDHVTSMSNLAAKLKTMGMDVTETFLVQFIINSLPIEFGQFQVNYNTLKDKWSFMELKAMLIQEEGRLKKIRDHSINLVATEKAAGGANGSKGNPSKRNKGKAPIKAKGSSSKEIKCFFCKKSGHMKKDCLKRKAWFEKKGIPYNPEHKGK